MGEIKRKMNTYEVTKVCEKCKRGKVVEMDGPVLTSLPPKIPHRCSKCGAEKHSNKTYPYIVFD